MIPKTDKEERISFRASVTRRAILRPLPDPAQHNRHEIYACSLLQRSLLAFTTQKCAPSA